MRTIRSTKAWLAAGVIAVVLSAATLTTGGPALADTRTPGEYGQAMLNSTAQSMLTGASFLSRPSNVATMVTTTPLASFPTDGSSYAILTTGDATLASAANVSGSSGADLGGPSIRGNSDFDVTVYALEVNVPAGNNCLVGVDVRFLSDEYPEFVGTSFNDAFIAELDQSTWTTSGSTITAPGNFAFDPAGNSLTINAAGVTSMSAAEANGTTYDGATPLLRARTPISPGSHTLYFSIFDQGDRVYDSAVFIDNIRFGQVANLAQDCRSGAIPAGTGHEYVAVGDSTTTGFSVPACHEDREVSPYGCDDNDPPNFSNGDNPPATPYPVRVAQSGNPRFDDLDRKGIWGSTIKEAVTAFQTGTAAPGQGQGKWIPQLIEAQRARELVTVSLGANDMEFSKVADWLKSCIKGKYKYAPIPTVDETGCTKAADNKLAGFQPALNSTFNALDAASNKGADVVVTLYYNPFNSFRAIKWFPDEQCGILHHISSIITSTLNEALSDGASAHGFLVADLMGPFEGHGAGAKDRWVFGTDCGIDGIVGSLSNFFDLDPFSEDVKQIQKAIQIKYDPHPNNKGTSAQAEAVLGVIS